MLDENPGVILVPNNCAGIEWVETWKNVLSLRASDSDDVYFRDVVVPDTNVLERALRPDDAPSAWFPMAVSAVYLGAAIAARNTVIQFALDRVPTALGKPIATLPKIQRQIGEIDLMLRSAQTFMFEACRAWTGRPGDRRERFAQIIAAKTLVNEAAPQATALALQIAGGSSITHALPLERYFRDSQPGFTHPPSGDTAFEIIGQQAIKTWQNRQI
jgi:alkylation response protein AidB-like acyl-CoA dehydrogenase